MALKSSTKAMRPGDDYRLGAGYEWVCRQCFDDLKDDLGWTASRDPA
jgi:hypothetical protein